MWHLGKYCELIHWFDHVVKMPQLIYISLLCLLNFRLRGIGEVMAYGMSFYSGSDQV